MLLFLCLEQTWQTSQLLLRLRFVQIFILVEIYGSHIILKSLFWRLRGQGWRQFGANQQLSALFRFILAQLRVY